MEAVLRRIETGDSGTFGLIQVKTYDSMLVLATLELPWRENQRNISCIPTGEYTANEVWSNRFKKKLYSLDPVPARSGILIHNGNWSGDTQKGLKSNSEGCILLGLGWGVLGGQRAVIHSKAALSLFHQFAHGKPFKIKVENAYD